MIITISLSKSDLERIHNVLGIKSYDDIHTAFYVGERGKI